ncbi:MAG: AraC family transcriptional regulator [Lachnospiraceae bacterium]|nr:AraC family transcriptional regulator [Lachnospiraceae bacterium]
MKKNLQTSFQTRQYMLSKDFEIYYYNDKNLPRVGLHAHDYYEFYFFLEGSISIQIDEEIHPLRVGDIILIPPGISHRPIIHDDNIPYRRFVLWISKDYCSHLLSLSPAYGYLLQFAQINKTYIYHNKQISFNTIQSMILRLLEELHADRFGREAQISLCLNGLLLHLSRTIHERNHPQAQNTELSLYHNVLTYMEDHIEEDLSLDKLADTFFVSKYHIAHIFKKNFGMSVHQYITKKRLTLCKEAILGGGNITDIYPAFGFGDYSSFYRAFQKEYGISPKSWKETCHLPEQGTTPSRSSKQDSAFNPPQ